MVFYVCNEVFYVCNEEILQIKSGRHMDNFGWTIAHTYHYFRILLYEC